MGEYEAVAFDVDGVLTEVDSAWRYIHSRLGTLEQARVNAELYRRGIIDYAEWARLDASLWRGIPYSRVAEIVEEIPLRRGARELMEYLRERGLVLVAISAGLDVVAERVRRELGMDCAISNKLLTEEGVVTGEVEVAVEYYNKGEVLEEVCREIGIETSACIAVGDSEVDVPMLERAGYGIAFDPKDEEVARVADEVVRSGDLGDLLEVFKRVLG